MKLAEALQIRADLVKSYMTIEQRLISNAKVQEGLEPAEKPADLLKVLDATMSRLEKLITRINLTNSQVTNDEGVTITELIARRDILQRRLQIMRRLVKESSNLIERCRTTEIRTVSTINVAETQKQVDAMAKKLREDDFALQQLNWTVDLI